MAVMIGECIVCGIDDIEINEITEECLTCTRLKEIEKRLDKLERDAHPRSPHDIVLD